MDDPRLLVPLLLVVDSLHYVHARLLVPHLPPSASGFYVMVLSALPVLAFNRGRFPLGVLRRHLVFFLSIGSLVAVSTNLGFAAMRFIDPGTASLLSRVPKQSAPAGNCLMPASGRQRRFYPRAETGPSVNQRIAEGLLCGNVIERVLPAPGLNRYRGRAL